MIRADSVTGVNVGLVVAEGEAQKPHSLGLAAARAVGAAGVFFFAPATRRTPRCVTEEKKKKKKRNRVVAYLVGAEGRGC